MSKKPNFMENCQQVCKCCGRILTAVVPGEKCYNCGWPTPKKAPPEE